MVGIYQIQSKVKPERSYVGSSVDIHKRMNLHRCLLSNNKHHSVVLQNHVNKYGLDDLQFSVIAECNKEDLILNEQTFMFFLKPYFNVCPNAGGRYGFNHSEETKHKISQSHIGIRPNEATRKLLSEQRKGNQFNKGHKQTEESKRKNSEKHIGKIWTEEHKRRQSERMRGEKNPAYGKNYKNVRSTEI